MAKGHRNHRIDRREPTRLDGSILAYREHSSIRITHPDNPDHSILVTETGVYILTPGGQRKVFDWSTNRLGSSSREPKPRDLPGQTMLPLADSKPRRRKAASDGV